jgi:hypothetical protein
VSGIRESITKFAGALAVLATFAMAPAADAYLTDSASHPPPTTGGHAYYNTYGTFGPNQAGFPNKGQSYVDPVFGSTVNRLTNEVGHQSFSDIYSKNGYFNANNTLMVHNTPSGRQFVNPQTGAVVRPSVPGNDNSSFDPLDPDVWWWYAIGGTTLNKYSVSSGTSTVVKTFSQPIGNNGGSIDWIDRTGRYMVLHLGNTWRMYDVKSDVLYANPIPDSFGNDPGYTGLTPDGNYIITTQNANPNAHRSWKVDHNARSVSTTGVIFWTLCGDHGDFVSASNGKSYWVVFECDTVSGVYAVDVSIPQSHGNKAKQLSDNKQLMKISWSDSGHFSRVSRGPLQDWAFGSIESGDDAFGAAVNNWRPFKQEIVMVNVLSGEVRRLAHHRSRSVFSNYYYQPRVSASWDGGFVAWASNMGLSQGGYADIYSIRVETGNGGGNDGGGGGGGGTTPSPVTLAFTNPASGATVSGTTTVTTSAGGGTGSGYTYTVKAGSTTIYSGTNPSFSWNTASTPNGSVTLTATVTDSKGATGSASRAVTVSNTVQALTGAFTSPASGATLSGTVSVAISGTGGLGNLTLTLKAGTTTIYSGPLSSFSWNTTTFPNGPVTLTATLADGSGASLSITRSVTIANGTPPTDGTPGSPATENVVWTAATRVTVIGNAITKTTGCDGCWDAGAISEQTITGGDGSIQFSTPKDAYLSVGLSNGNPGTTANEIKFALKVSPGYVEVRESGVYKADWKYKAGAAYKIAVEGGTVTYYENDKVKYTSTQTPVYPLVVDSTIGSMGGSVQAATITRPKAGNGGTPPPPNTPPVTTPPTTPPIDPPTDPPIDPTTPPVDVTPPPPNTGQPVVWIDVVRATASDGTLTKVKGCNGCGDAGAVSQQAITSGDGSVTFKASANAYLTIGLSKGNKNTQVNEIRFGLRFTPGTVEVRESGRAKVHWPYVADAVYTIAVEDGQVKYYENGTLRYTSTVTPAYPLIVDTTLNTIGAGVQDVTLTK